MTDASGATIFNYDTLGRLTTINYGNGIRQNYAYDKSDRVSNLKVMQGSLKQMNLNYEYDKVGRLTAVRDNGKKFGYSYNAIGQLTEELNGVTGIKSSYKYYPSGNIKNLRYFDGKNVVSNYEYKYDKRGNQTLKDEGPDKTMYYYDPLSRIKTALAPDKIQNYEYDDLDNIKELTEIKDTKIEQTSYLYDKDSRLLLQETDKGSENVQHRFTYDAVGNQLTKDEVVKRNGSTIASKTFNYWYNGFNQLSRVQNPDGQFTDYTYNGIGLRTKKDFGDKATNYYYNGGNIILETDKNNAVTAKNVRGLRLIYRESYANGTDPTYLFYLHNAHGDVTQLLNEKGQVIKDYRYDAFGKEEMPESKVFGGKQTTELWRQEVEKIDNPFRYCGEYLDEETGNYYLRARYYDPNVQRFTSEDSYGVEKGAAWKEHLYGYGNNNPMRFIDVTGHWGESVHKNTTIEIAKKRGIYGPYADIIGQADIETDDDFSTTPIIPSNESQGWHFDNNPDPNVDSRKQHSEENLQLSVQIWKNADEQYKKNMKKIEDMKEGSKKEWLKRLYLNNLNNSRKTSFETLGKGLHALQDIDAHMDYDADDESAVWWKHHEGEKGNLLGPTDTFDDPSKDFIKTLNGAYYSYDGTTRFENTKKQTFNYLDRWANAIFGTHQEYIPEKEFKDKKQ
ncbi:MAG: hypothetical protein CVV03_12650 [Firmicutes bacterium HGW-Firmicutes-8]|nr:MAG: hypothetical protein CVV03_12650 [Firmicutes bacterium HGW-Firmicutes-8]